MCVCVDGGSGSGDAEIGSISCISGKDSDAALYFSKNGSGEI